MKGSNRPGAAALLLATAGWLAPAPSVLAATGAETSPCQESIDQLLDTYRKDAAFRALTDRALASVQPLPGEFGTNPWIGKDIYGMADFFSRWCTFLPSIEGSHDDGLKYIQEFAWFYYKNEYGMAFVKQDPGKTITRNFAKQRGRFMDSEASAGKVTTTSPSGCRPTAMSATTAPSSASSRTSSAATSWWIPEATATWR